MNERNGNEAAERRVVIWLSIGTLIVSVAVVAYAFATHLPKNLTAILILAGLAANLIWSGYGDVTQPTITSRRSTIGNRMVYIVLCAILTAEIRNNYRLGSWQAASWMLLSITLCTATYFLGRAIARRRNSNEN